MGGGLDQRASGKVTVTITSTPRTVSQYFPWVAASISVAVLIGVHAFSALGTVLPIYWEDEAGYLANAQVLAGVGTPPDLRGQPYYIGWSLLLVPAWWISQDARIVYEFAVALSAALGVVVGALLTVVGRRLGLSLPWAIVAGATIAASPSRAVFSSFGLAETLLVLCVVAALLSALHYSASRSGRAAASLATFSALAFATHGRAIPLVIATGILLAWNLRFRGTRAASVGGLVVLLVVSIGSFMLYRSVTGQLYGESAARESIGISRILTPELLPTLWSAVGQAWYVHFAWLGLATLGVVLLVRQVREEWRSRVPAWAAWYALAFTGAAVISVTFISGPFERGSARLDILSYGRYLEPYVIPLAMLGLVLVLRGVTSRIVLYLLAGSGLLAAVWYFTTWRSQPAEGNAWWAPINVGGMLQYPWESSQRLVGSPWFFGALVAGVALVLLLVLRRRVIAWVLVVLVFFVASAVRIEDYRIRPFASAWNQSFTMVGMIRTTPELSRHAIAFDLARMEEFGDIASRNAYQLLLAPQEVVLWNSEEAPTAPADLVIARADWPLADRFGAVKVADDLGPLFSNSLWVLPGDTREQLEEAGLLE